MSGGTLYVVECYEDWLDDGHDITNRFQDGGRTRWMGEQALRIALRSIDGGQKARIVHSRQFDLREGQLSQVFLPEPIHYFQPTEDGKFELRRFGKSGGFDLKATPALLESDKYVQLKYTLKRSCPLRSKIQGTDFEAGEPVLSDVWIDSGTRTVPLGATLLIESSRRDGRCTLLLLHIATVHTKGS
jgi:hypothetical protein